MRLILTAPPITLLVRLQSSTDLRNCQNVSERLILRLSFLTFGRTWRSSWAARPTTVHRRLKIFWVRIGKPQQDIFWQSASFQKEKREEKMFFRSLFYTDMG